MEAQNRMDLEPSNRYTADPEEIRAFVCQARELGFKVVLTQGTFDMVHIGHARYVRQAKKHGDLLIIGIDDDKKARGRKGDNRPVVPFDERWEMMAHLRYVDLITVKKDNDPKWHLIKLVRPDVLIGVEGTYTDEEVKELKGICTEVVILPRQAETSTSAKVRKLVLDGAENLTRILSERLPQFVQQAYNELKENGK